MPFELEWLGGAAERAFRRQRPAPDDVPWSSLDPAPLPPAMVDEARLAWTDYTIAEHRTARAFAEVVQDLLAMDAPLDLIGMASGCLTDELAHVELCARVAAQLGGAAPVEVAPGVSSAEGDEARSRASTRVVRLACVGESLSVPLLVGAAAAANHPVPRAVLTSLARDESQHARFGWIFLDWADGWMGDGERARLGRVATDALLAFGPLWQRLASRPSRAPAAGLHPLGWSDPRAYLARTRAALEEDVLSPLAARGVEVDAARVRALLSG